MMATERERAIKYLKDLVRQEYKDANEPLKKAYEESNKPHVDLLNAKLAQIDETFRFPDERKEQAINQQQ